jgi:ribonuclease HI
MQLRLRALPSHNPNNAPVTVDDDDLARVVARELRLLETSCRADRACVAELLHPDFCEHCSSGVVWIREDALTNLPADPVFEGEAYGFRPVRLGPDAVLLTYRIRGPRPSLRSSLWLRDEAGAWRLRFHQGTRVASPEPA